MRGTQLHAGGQDTFIVQFFNTRSGADTVTTVSTTTETVLGVIPPGTLTGKANVYSHWTAPWPCAISEVFVEASMGASGDIMDFRVRREDLAALATADDVIRNAVSASAVDYLRLTGTATGGYKRLRYTGVLQDTSVAPYHHVTTASSDTATGFLDSERVLAAGDRISATYKMGAAGDLASHVRCIVTLAKLDSV